MTNQENLKALVPIPSSISPWLSVSNGAKAVEFYQAAFGAIQTYRLDAPDGGVVAKLSVDGAEFWLSGESTGNTAPAPKAESSIRMILTVTDPDTMFVRALNAGATEVFPVGEGHGWRLGRLEDPFGYHWEIGRPLDA